MKRIIICAIIMIFIIILGIVSYAYTDNAMDEAEKSVEQISESFGEGNFDRTKSLTRELSKMWHEKCESYIFIFDKDHIMELTAVISRIEAFAEDENPETTVECKTAAELIRLYRSKEKITLTNIF